MRENSDICTIWHLPLMQKKFASMCTVHVYFFAHSHIFHYLRSGAYVEIVWQCKRTLKAHVAKNLWRLGRRWPVWIPSQNQKNNWPVSICEHPGFQTNCLNPWVLEQAYMANKQQYGHRLNFNQSEYINNEIIKLNKNLPLLSEYGLYM